MWSKIIAGIKNKHFLSLAGNVIMSGLGMVTMAIIYRALPIAEAGIWVFFQSILLLVDTFRSGFLTTAFIKFYAGSTKERMDDVAGSTWYIAMCITGILLLVNIPAFFFLDLIKDAGIVMFFKWFGICYIFTLPWFIATCILQGDQRFDHLLYVRLVNQGSFIIIVLVLIFTGHVGLMNVLFAYLAANLLTSIYALIMGWAKVGTIRSRTKGTIKEIFDFGKFSVGTTLSANMFRTSDVIIINFMLNKTAVAIYNLGQTLMQLVEIPLRSFAATGMPELSAAYNQDQRSEVIRVMKKYVGMLTIILIPAVLIGSLLADVPIYIIGGGKYVGTEAANVFRLFLTFALLYPADRFFALTLDVIHKPKVNFYKVLMMLAANIIFDFLGIMVLKSIYGVAVTTVMPVLVGVIVGFIALQKYQKFSFISVYKTGYAETMALLAQLKEKIKPSKAA